MGDISRVIPLNVHADGVETFHDVEFHVFSWASALTYKGIGDVLDKIFLVLVLDEIRMIPHVTYSMVVQFLKWSLAAMNTGHSGSISTLHANGPRDALSRLETMVLSSHVGLPLQAIREQIGSAIQLVVHQMRLPSGRRVITDVVEILRVESGTIQMQQLTRFDYFQQKLVGAGLRPVLFESLGRQPEPSMLNWFLPA